MVELRAFLDRCVCLFVVAPLVVAYWRGLWNLLDDLVLPDQPALSGWATACAGWSVAFALTALQEPFALLARRYPKSVKVVFRLHQFIYGAASISAWRGTWLVEDVYTGKSPWSALGALLVGIGALLLCRGLRNAAQAPPLMLVIDEAPDCFKAETRFRRKPEDGVGTYLMDCCFSTVVIGSLVVTLWRGLWTLLDRLQIPDSPLTSATTSLSSGFVTTVGLFLAEGSVRQIHAHAHKTGNTQFWGLLLEGMWNLCATYSVVAVWRALWMLADQVVCGSVLWDLVITLASGWVLSLLCCSTSVPNWGTVVDGVAPTSEFPPLSLDISYFTAMAEVCLSFDHRSQTNEDRS
ncbi:uncharacterized protein LOC8024881 isoform X1 [Ixodes scapularis]|uniref:uncharacterized protein LOC8024881 isoform X1 n=1 Tax=Ixodes scapularis TaxID=6945 RepID=UPI001A9E1C51|nr:uncharacterized protein LOC8024881 isoform X1 [Ixodes scapularis]XP_040065764.1 uncharacterized protein LOC8024881 isoform X1 [Ixodes scapularis]XP_040065765.1 uncharacterized protein LOC8024881 isoform X1 [Ixodes scapularis]